MLKKISVQNLFDTFTYTVELSSGGITILTGPNGFGKSTIFALLSAVLSGRTAPLLVVPFDALSLYFTRGKILTVKKNDDELTVDGHKIESDDALAAAVKGYTDGMPVALISGHSLSAADKIKSITFDPNRAEETALYTTLLNGKLSYKKLVVCDDGAYLTDLKTGTRRIPLEALSSGEQQLAVFYHELIFDVKSGAVVLIDEPEISLHIVWQMALIKDLFEIFKFKRYGALLLATHSPQILTGNWDLQVDLGEMNED